MNDIEDETEGNDQPCWRFSLWDVAGITAHAVCGTLIHVGQSVGILAREFQAAANHSRQQRDLYEYHRQRERDKKQMAADLSRIVDGPS